MPAALNIKKTDSSKALLLKQFLHTTAKQDGEENDTRKKKSNYV